MIKPQRRTGYYFVSRGAVVRPLVSVGIEGSQLPPLEVTRKGRVVPSTPRPVLRPFVIPWHSVLRLIVVRSPMVRAAFV